MNASLSGKLKTTSAYARIGVCFFFDIVGFIVGAVEKEKMIDSSRVRESDILLGIPSNGLHTNGYSLVRHSLSLDSDMSPLNEVHAELESTLGDALLMEHRCYYQIINPVFFYLN